MMLLHTKNIFISDSPLYQHEKNALLLSANAMSAFIPKLTELPESTYLRVSTVQTGFIGAVHIEETEPFSDMVTIHPMLLERDRALFAEVTEAAIIWCLNKQLVPTAHVLDTVEYEYMHKFMTSLQLNLSKEHGWRVYRLPSSWKPSFVKRYTIGFA